MLLVKTPHWSPTVPALSLPGTSELPSFEAEFQSLLSREAGLPVQEQQGVHSGSGPAPYGTASLGGVMADFASPTRFSGNTATQTITSAQPQDSDEDLDGENDNDSPSESNKRKARASKACLECRRGKVRCLVQDTPPCSRCKTLQKSCQFAAYNNRGKSSKRKSVSPV